MIVREQLVILPGTVRVHHSDLSVHPVSRHVRPAVLPVVRAPYAGLVLDGVKTVESRWRPLLAPLENHTLAIHIAWRDWEGDEWRAVLSGALGMSGARIQELLDSGERFGRGVVAGLVDVGSTWLCPTSLPEAELQHLERSAVLIGLQEKYLTHLSNPRWLKEPLKARGSRDLWTVEIPVKLLP